jgi:hypothetical protein
MMSSEIRSEQSRPVLMNEMAVEKEGLVSATFLKWSTTILLACFGIRLVYLSGKISYMDALMLTGEIKHPGDKADTFYLLMNYENLKRNPQLWLGPVQYVFLLLTPVYVLVCYYLLQLFRAEYLRIAVARATALLLIAYDFPLVSNSRHSGMVSVAAAVKSMRGEG